MTAALIPFRYGDQPVRVVTIDGEPWFVLADLAKVLGIADVQRLNSRLDDGVRQTHPIEDRLGRTQQATIVSEAGMYEVVIRSDKPEAAAFRRWVTSEVLPSIRKTGSYSATPQLSEDQIVQQALAITAARVEKLTAQLAIAQPKADAFDRWLSSNVDYPVAVVANALAGLGADLGRNRLFAWLDANHWIYRTAIKRQWHPLQTQIDTGRLSVRLGQQLDTRSGEQFATFTVRITAKGAVEIGRRFGLLPEAVADALAATDDLAA